MDYIGGAGQQRDLHVESGDESSTNGVVGVERAAVESRAGRRQRVGYVCRMHRLLGFPPGRRHRYAIALLGFRQAHRVLHRPSRR